MDMKKRQEQKIIVLKAGNVCIPVKAEGFKLEISYINLKKLLDALNVPVKIKEI